MEEIKVKSELRKVHVVVHGLWAFEVHATGILVRTIKHHHHFLGAGSDRENRVPLDPEGRYVLNGVQEGPQQRYFDTRENVIMGEPPTSYPTAPFCEVALRTPRRIRSIRQWPTLGKHPYSQSPPFKAPRVSMLQVLTYRVESAAEVALTQADGTVVWRPDPSLRVGKLHLFSQPETRVGDDHFKEAFKALAKKYGFQHVDQYYTLAGALEKPISIEGMQDEDQLGLNENALNMEAVKGVSGSNCESLVFQSDVPDPDA
jgi:hypothetical protein